MDPVLAAYSLGVLNRDSVRRQATLLASLHAVELALEHFPRVIGVRAGRILFDKAAAQVTPVELEALYANEQLDDEQTLLTLPDLPLHVPRC